MPHYANGHSDVTIVIFSLSTLLAPITSLDKLVCFLAHCWPKVTYPNHFLDQGPCFEMISANSPVYFAEDVSGFVSFYAFEVRLEEYPFLEYAIKDGESNCSLLYLLSFFWI